MIATVNLIQNRMAVGKGCFKCGSPDHIAKDCPEDAMNQQTAKYILKDDNAQRGGENARFVLVIAFVCQYVCPNV